VVDRRIGTDGFIGRLTALNAWQWIGLILLIALIMPLIGGVFIEAIMVTFESVHNFRGLFG
jgi:hypothetical protein